MTETEPTAGGRALPVRCVGSAAIEGSGISSRVRFSLKMVDETTIEFECDPIQLGAIHTDLQLLYAKVSGEITPKDLFCMKVDVPFDTKTGYVAYPQGKSYTGHFMFFFETQAGHLLATGIGPNLAQGIYETLHGGLSGLEQKPEASNVNFFNRMFVPGVQVNISKSLEAFGQEYPAPIIQQLGIFMVRANLLEKSMIQLLATVSGVNETIASALFYSTVNVRARITMVQAAVDAIGLDAPEMGLIQRAMDAVSAVTQRRNVLVHGFWHFKKDKFEVESFEPTKSSRSQNEVVTEKSLRILISDYYQAGILLEMASRSVAAWREKQPPPPSAGSPPGSIPSPNEVLIPRPVASQE